MDAFDYLTGVKKLCDSHYLCIDCPFHSGKCILTRVEWDAPELAIHAVEKFLKEQDGKD